jgi:hypothetical protein
MNHFVFRAALRASAKVALGAAFAACGGVVGSTAAPSAAEAAAPDAASVDATPNAVSVDATPNAVSVDATPVDVSSPLDAPKQEAGACDAPSPSSVLPEGAHADAAAEIGQSTFDCCVAMLKVVLPDEGGLAFPDAAVGNPEVQACCATVIARLDYDKFQPDASTIDQQDQQAAQPVSSACCQVTFAVGPTCTPWGPPMPPAMPGEVA